MDLPDYTAKYPDDEIERLALNTLSDWCGGNIEIPVPVDAIIEAGAYVDRIILMKGLNKECGVSGTIVVRPSSVVIVVDQDEYEYEFVRGRSTLAHELGHFLMHDAVWNHPNEYTEEEAVHINECLEDAYETIEAQADYFAQALLMPYDLFVAYVEDVYAVCAKVLGYNCAHVTSHITNKCSVKFNVPRGDVVSRLKSTGCTDRIIESSRRRADYL